ncbi:MAG TPA: tRNA (N(6)-L-threonylcarbamoyladenosine(37)-C(2))-methylthiotransferase MtaB [Stellaceae bacterium]|nr:tRNA (N(6)-L-threonylcarbamoyladenosine(37)-C(2))-methylthiotransferase MtaB [Stellaceae bacterium]
MNGVDIVTFGCRLNALESAAIGRAAGAAGLADAVIINTCAVTAEAERQARQAIRRMRRERPAARIIVTGCAATLAPARYAALGDVDLVLDNAAKLQAESYAIEIPPPPGLSGPPGSAPAARQDGSISGARRTRAYLQVQQGCDHRCTFCIIPYARGPSRSLPPAAIIAEARRLIAAGCPEIVLTGVDLTAYGADLLERPALGDLVRRLLAAVPELTRLRLSSLDPAEIDDGLWGLVADEPRLLPHLHLSLQAGDDLILKRMKRRHSRAAAVAAARRARALRPDIALGADLIAGFPTETEDMFRRSLDLIDECGIAFLHVFPYSPRPGTPAARMPPVDPAIVRERARQLRQAGAAALAAELARRVGGESDVLIERSGRGRADCYATVRFDGADEAGSTCRLRFIGARDGELVGVPA